MPVWPLSNVASTASWCCFFLFCLLLFMPVDLSMLFFCLFDLFGTILDGHGLNSPNRHPERLYCWFREIFVHLLNSTWCWIKNVPPKVSSTKNLLLFCIPQFRFKIFIFLLLIELSFFILMPGRVIILTIFVFSSPNVRWTTTICTAE